MKHVHEPTSGSIAANHRHAFTNESFNYLANFDLHGSEIEWAAKVRLQDDVVGELRGNATLTRQSSGAVDTVRHAVNQAIDGRDFFDRPDQSLRQALSKAAAVLPETSSAEQPTEVMVEESPQ